MPRSCRRRQWAAAACAGSKRPQRCLLGFPRLPARLAGSSSSPAMRCVTSGSSSAHGATLDACPGIMVTAPVLRGCSGTRRSVLD